MEHRTEFLWGLGLTLVGTALWVGFSLAGWPGELHPCVQLGDCYCEAPRPGPIAQPANTWSLLGYIFVGLWIGYDVGTRRRVSPRADNPLLCGPIYGTLYTVTTIALGFMSIAFHASLTDWGGVADALSMFGWLGMLFCFNLRSLFRWSNQIFLASYGVLVAARNVPRRTIVDDVDVYFGWFVLAYLATELAVARPAWFGLGSLPQLTRDRRPFLAGLATFGISLAIWSMSRAGGQLCDPASLLQGHAVWHILNAGVNFLVYLYLLSQREAPYPRSPIRQRV
jgi:hypothetical protein